MQQQSESESTHRIEQFIRERTYFKNVTPKTIAWYRQSFGAFHGSMADRTALGNRIAKLRERGVSATSVNTYLRTINAYFRWLHTEGHVSELVRVPKLKEDEKILATMTPEQVQRIIGYKPRGKYQHRIYTLACLLLDTGLRIDEALSLRRDEVDFDNLLLHIHGKGRKERVVPISAEGRKILWKWSNTGNAPGSSGLLFATRDGNKLGQRNMLRHFKVLGTRLQITGVRFSFHTLRHTFALNYIRNGGDVFRLQRILGHSTLEMTRRYVNLQTSDLQAVHNRLSPLTRR